MSFPNNMDSDIGTWIFRAVLLGIAFLLGLDVREAKRNLAAVPGLAKGCEMLEKSVDRLERRIEALEQKR